ncbi:hypothetical protein AVEN_118495-1 [Araneus ventricosus]|uniref:Uncharacterized protein n=1 Tax=Araneus ventricosus TaxID=182803 RepID=A0A4Y2NR71_ARAVE|nr:hypothetical protein AVEN_118495-1 [Araneus ventricosus]
MASTSNNMFYKSAKTLNELVMRLGNQTYEEINIIIANAEKPKKMPQTNPFLIQEFVKKSVSRHEQIENMKYTRQVHIGPCQQPEKCINCNGSRNAKSRSCPFYIKEQKILELKCRNHITTGEARHIFQQNNAKYSETVKTMPAVTNLEDTINAKFETLLQAINDRFERQMTIFADMLQKSMDCICQNFCKIMAQCVDPSSSPVRKKKLFSNLRQMSDSVTSWDAGGSKDTEDMPLC